MTKFKPIVGLLSLFLFISACDLFMRPGPCDASGPVIVYKTKQDYINNVTVQLSKDHHRITSYPGKDDAIHEKPIQLANGYLLKRMNGDTYLSLTIDEYYNSTKEYSLDDLYKLIIDTDPYLEKYECCECTGKDTSKINNLIKTNQLNNCRNIK